MQCCHALWRATAASPSQPLLLHGRGRSSGSLPCSTTRGFAHPEQFTYRPKPSPLKAPSLRRGWILSHNHGTPDRALEILLPRWEEGQDSERGEDLSQAHQLRRKGEEGEEYSVEGRKVGVASVENGRGIDRLVEEYELEVSQAHQLRRKGEDGEEYLCSGMEYSVDGRKVSVTSVENGRGNDRLVDEYELEVSPAHQLRRKEEGEEYSVEGRKARVSSVENGRGIEGLVEEYELEDEERPILTKPKYVRGPAIDKKSFIRIYYISALRVSATECWDLAFELRKHLLNWPRVNNIGRVPGDDVDEDLATVFVEAVERKTRVTPDEIRAAVYTDLETELSGKKLSVEADRKGSGKRGKVSSSEAATLLELVEPEDQNEQEIDPSADGVPYLFRSRKWTGPTRLLLLDEMYVGKMISELHPDLQAVYSRFEHLNSKTGLTNCRMSIFYEYWTMDEVLRELLPAEAHAPVKFDRAGHVAELRLHPEHLPFRHLIAQVTLEKNNPTVRSVVLKRDVHDAQQYAMQLEILAGTTSLATTAWEFDIPFRIDMAYMIWDPRLSSERRRLVNLFARNDVVCDICAGVGPVAIPASKKVRMVYANDVNSLAHQYLVRNVIENKVSGRIEVFNEDIETFLGKIFYVGRPLPITQVIMSHPLPAAEFLGLFRGLFSRRTWPNAFLPRIHLYRILGDNDPEERLSKEIEGVLQSTDCEISTRLVVETAGGEWIVSASFILPEEFGFK